MRYVRFQLNKTNPPGHTGPVQLNKSSNAIRKHLRCISVLLIIICCVAGESGLAATYYVSKVGADTNPGSQSLPWLTIQKAANTVVSGDTVYVQSGFYGERVVCNNSSGTENSPITFVANDMVSNYGWSFSKPYYTVQGFTVTGETLPQYQGTFTINPTAQGTKIIDNIISHSTSITYIFGVLMTGRSFGVSPANCLIQNNRILEPSYHALYIQGQGHLIEGNYFTGTKGWDAIRALSANTIYRRNVFENWSNLISNTNHTDLIQAFADNGEIATNVLVEGNIASNCIGAQIGNITDTQSVPTGNVGYWTWRNNIFFNVECAMNIYADHFEFYNNVFVRSGRNTGTVFVFRTSTDRGSAHYGKVYNNIFLECGTDPARPNVGWYGTYVAPGAPSLEGFEADHNLVIGTGAGTTKTGFNEPHGLNGVQPRFVDLDRLDFHLAEGSPAIGAGKNLYALFTTDFAGAVRDTSLPWDVGAFVYNQANPVRPTTPQNFRISTGQ